MKEFFKILLFAVMVMGAIATVVVLAGQGPNAKSYSCQEYSAACELQKNLVLISPITFDSGIIDVYGDPIKNQWYIMSPKVRVLAPITVLICIGGNVNAGPVYNYNPTAEQILNDWGSKVRIDTLDMSEMVPSLTKAALIVCGANEIIRDNGNRARLACAE